MGKDKNAGQATEPATTSTAPTPVGDIVEAVPDDELMTTDAHLEGHGIDD